MSVGVDRYGTVAGTSPAFAPRETELCAEITFQGSDVKAFSEQVQWQHPASYDSWKRAAQNGDQSQFVCSFLTFYASDQFFGIFEQLKKDNPLKKNILEQCYPHLYYIAKAFIDNAADSETLHVLNDPTHQVKIQIILSLDSDKLEIKITDKGVGLDTSLVQNLFFEQFSTKKHLKWVNGSNGKSLNTIRTICTNSRSSFSYSNFGESRGAVFSCNISLANILAVM